MVDAYSRKQRKHSKEKEDSTSQSCSLSTGADSGSSSSAPVTCSSRSGGKSSRRRTTTIVELHPHCQGHACDNSSVLQDSGNFQSDDDRFSCICSSPTYKKFSRGMAENAPPPQFAVRFGLKNQEWFAGRITRSRAEQLLMENDPKPGTFLIREREDDPPNCALSVFSLNIQSEPSINHYIINQTEIDHKFYISERKTFTDMNQLIKYYKEAPHGLCCKLRSPARMTDFISNTSKKNFEILPEELRFFSKVGCGNFGEVWHGMWRNQVEVAIKTMKPGTMTGRAFIGEADMMKQCDHPNLVKLYAVCTSQEPLLIVTEYMTNGSLLTFLKKKGNALVFLETGLDLFPLMDICTQIANGMRHLESLKLVHRDLAARNVLVGNITDGIPVVKVADFGLARRLMEEVDGQCIYLAHTGAKFPVRWTAPEAASTNIFTVQSDVWSYGVLLYETFTFGGIPYAETSQDELVDKVKNGYRLSRPPICPKQVYNKAMAQCWELEPAKRPTFEELFHFLAFCKAEWKSAHKSTNSKSTGSHYKIKL